MIIYLIMIPIFFFGSGLWLVLRNIIKPKRLIIDLIVVTVLSLSLWWLLITKLSYSNHLLGILSVLAAIGGVCFAKSIEPVACVLEWLTRRLQRPSDGPRTLSRFTLNLYLLIGLLAVHRGIVYLPDAKGFFGRTVLGTDSESSVEKLTVYNQTLGLSSMTSNVYDVPDAVAKGDLSEVTMNELRFLTARNLVVSNQLDPDYAILDTGAYVMVVELVLLLRPKHWLSWFFAFKRS